MKKLQGLGKSIFYISFPLSFIGFILPIYATNLGASPFEVGVLYSVFALFSILARPFVGSWIDKVGRKKGFIVGLIFYLVVALLFSIGDSYKYILAARVMQSIAASFMWISIYTMISDVSNQKNNSKNIGHIDQIANKGEMIGATIGFMILFNNWFNDSLKMIFSIFIISSIIGLYYGITKTEETLEYKNDNENEEEQNLYSTKNNNIEKIKLDKKHHTKEVNNSFIKFLIIMGVLAFVGSMISPVFLLYLRDNITNNLSQISFLFIPSAVLAMFLPKKFGAFADKYGRRKVLIIGMLFQAISMIMIPFVKTYYGFMILYTCFSAFSFLRFPAQTALVTEITGNKKRGKSYGLYCFATGIGGVIGPLVGSSVYQYINEGLIFYIEGVTLLIVSILIMMLINKTELNRDTPLKVVE